MAQGDLGRTCDRIHLRLIAGRSLLSWGAADYCCVDGQVLYIGKPCLQSNALHKCWRLTHLIRVAGHNGYRQRGQRPLTLEQTDDQDYSYIPRDVSIFFIAPVTVI
jgi:hypothetical protein